MDYHCPRCDTTKPESEVYLRSNGSILRCKACQREADRAYYAKNPERRRKQKRDARRRELLREYGLTVAEYEDLVEAANGRCAICEEINDRLEVDHCHETGVVRGMLCPRCNKALGLLDDSPASLRRAIEYLSM